MPKRPGRKSAAQTPAPQSEKIYGSTKNLPKSASSEKSASTIKLSEKIIKSLKVKLKEFQETHKTKKVSLNDLKAVYRRGLGAYSSSHRPTITGGVPNTRNAWAMARVNKFLKKASGEKVKAAYVQDDDLLKYEKGGDVDNLFDIMSVKQTQTLQKQQGLLENGGNINEKMAKGAKIKAKGDCYYMAGQFAMDNIFTPKKIDYIGTPYLVHAEVQGQGAISNIRYGHAWIEDDENVYDFSNNRELVIPKEIYYAIGGINTDNPKKYQKYTFAEARKKMVETGIYGCWDLEVDYADGGKTETGGETDKEIICVNCTWEWNMADSEDSDKYVCHKCGFDNTLFYTVMKETMTLNQIAEKHGVDMEYLQKQFEKGSKHEMDEHTKGGTDISREIGETIALHHLEEMPDYYEKLDKIESVTDSNGLPEENQDNEFIEFYQPNESEIEYVRYSVWYLDCGETYDFYELYDAVDHIREKNERGVIRDYDGKKIMGYDDIEQVINGKKSIKEYENGGITEEEPELKTQYDISEYLSQQKEEADAILFSRRTQIAKFMICNAYIDMAEEKMKRAENAIELNAWEQVKNIWKETKNEVDDVIYMYEDGGTAGGCGCTKYMSKKKFSKGGLAYGNSHDKGGMPMKVKSTGQNIEIEGGEGVINKRSMQMTKKVEFEGKQMTPCEVISKINQMGGGVKFDCSDVKQIIEKDGEF